MSDSSRLNFPYIVNSHILDALVQPVIEGALVNTPPVSPAAGVLYVVGRSPSGAWAGKADSLAQYINDVWTFYVPFEGLTAWNKASKSRWYYSGTEWSELSDDQHGKRIDNPHKVTAAQLGAETPSGAQAKANAVQTNLTAHVSNGTHKWSSITDKPSTLQDYGIRDAYTKTEIDSYQEEAKTQIGAEQSELGVEIKGRTLVNLLGVKGNVGAGQLLAHHSNGVSSNVADTTVQIIGVDCGKMTFNATSASRYCVLDTLNATQSGKYYIALATIKSSLSDNSRAVRLTVYQNGWNINKGQHSLTTNGGIQTLYKKFVGESTYSDVKLGIDETGSDTSSLWYDGLRLYEITQAEYNAIDSMTEAQVAAKYPYVDSIKFKKDVLVTQIGKNMLPSLSSGEWASTGPSYYTTNNDYSTTVTNPPIWCIKYVRLNVVAGKTYTGSVTVNNVSTTGRVGLHYSFFDANGSPVTNNFLCYTTITSGTVNLTGSITVPASAVTCRIGFDNDSTFTGTCTFSNFQFELSSTATTFEPQVKSYAHTLMQIAQDESVWLTPNTSVYEEVWKKNVVLDGSQTYSFGASYTGFKRVTIRLEYVEGFPHGIASEYPLCTKYDSSVLGRYFSNWTSSDLCIVDNNDTNSTTRSHISISNTDTGWIDTMTPNVSEIKAYFYGWKMCASDGGSYVSGTKYWKKITDGTGVTSTTPTASYLGYTPYVLHYKLATPVYHINYYNNDPTKPIMSAGSVVNIPQGITQIEQISGIAWKEKANPYLSGSTYYINSTASSALSYRSKSVKKIYRNATIDLGWTVATYNPINATYGVNQLTIPQVIYDSTSTYTVTYEQLDKYLYTIDTFAIDNPVPTRQRNFSLDSTEQKIAYFKVNPVSIVGATANQNPKKLADYGILDAYTKDSVDAAVNTKLNSADSLANGTVYKYRDVTAYHLSGTATGTAKIMLPVSWLASTIVLAIEGWSSAGTNISHWDVTVSGFTQGSGNWILTAATLHPNCPFSSVRFGFDSVAGKCCILLGTTTTAWDNIKIVVKEAFIGNSNVAAYVTGWSMSIIADETTLTKIVVPTTKNLAYVESGALTVNNSSAGNIRSGYFNNTDYASGNKNYIQVRQQVASNSSYSVMLGVDKDTGNAWLSNDAITVQHLSIAPSGNTSMSGNLSVYGGTVALASSSTSPAFNMYRNTTLSANGTIGKISFLGGNGTNATAALDYGGIRIDTMAFTAGAETGALVFSTRTSGLAASRVAIDNSGLVPYTTNTYTLGKPSSLWSQIYAASATINTSDRNAKKDITDLDLGLDFINSLRPVEFKYKVRQNEVTSEQCGVETVEIEPERTEIQEVSPAIYEVVEVSPAMYSTIEIVPAEYDEEGNLISEAVTETILEKEAVVEQRLVSAAVTEDVMIPAVIEERPIYKEVVTPLPGVRTHAGLIAQEVEEALNGKDLGIFTVDEQGNYGLRYEEFIAPLIKAIQELSVKVEQQAAEIAKLKQ